MGPVTTGFGTAARTPDGTTTSPRSRDPIASDARRRSGIGKRGSPQGSDSPARSGPDRSGPAAARAGRADPVDVGLVGSDGEASLARHRAGPFLDLARGDLLDPPAS